VTCNLLLFRLEQLFNWFDRFPSGEWLIIPGSEGERVCRVLLFSLLEIVDDNELQRTP
jgi:hypothetical protein